MGFGPRVKAHRRDMPYPSYGDSPQGPKPIG